MTTYLGAALTVARGAAYRVAGSEGRPVVVRVKALARAYPNAGLYRCAVVVLGTDGREVGEQRAPMFVSPARLAEAVRVQQFDRLF